MALQIIGAGVGRTGTRSLKLAINQLGLGPCHHMEAVLGNRSAQVPLWSAALNGRPDWQAIYDSFNSAVDWPTAAFFRELVVAYPTARFVLTHRSPESWVDSFTATIYKLLGERDQAPPEMKSWPEFNTLYDMVSNVVSKTGFPGGLDREDLMKAYVAHNEAVKAAIPASQLLVYDVKEGWEPLCAFLGVPVPDEPFPQTNRREEFLDITKWKF